MKMVNCKLTTIANKTVYCRLLLAMRCLSLGAIEGVWVVGVHLMKKQPDPQAHDMSCSCAVVPLLTTRFLSWEYGVLGLAGGVGYQGCWAVSRCRAIRGLTGGVGAQRHQWPAGGVRGWHECGALGVSMGLGASGVHLGMAEAVGGQVA